MGSAMKKILVVDDSAAIRQQLLRVLGEAGFEVVEASDGVEGIEAINAMDLALVICDVNMPRMGGMEMLEAVKAEAKNAKLPILMLTTDGHPGLISRARAAGARGWLVKPFKPDQLVSTARRLTELPCAEGAPK